MKKQSRPRGELASLLVELEDRLEPGERNPIDASAWFLGPKAENAHALLKFVKLAAKSQIKNRREYMPDDPPIFTDYDDPRHQRSIGIIKSELKKLLKQLHGSIPLASYRNQSHMYWDITLPGAIGYFAAMLYNQNNVAAEASPVTTLLEVQVGKDLCAMLGFDPAACEDHPDAVVAWGHITCDGSVANGEAMWAARNLKFLPVALAAAIEREAALQGARCFSATTCQGRRARLIDLSLWELLNLPVDEVLGMAERIETECAIDAAAVRAAIDAYSVQNVGLVDFQRRFLETHAQASPLVLVPATAHYSWPKTGALIGVGTDAVRAVEVDLDGRMETAALRRVLCDCLQQQRPVMQVVAVMGSTEEGAVDPLTEIVAMRREFRQQGLDFALHVDGAWGGYFRSLLRPSPINVDPAAIIDEYPELWTNRHFEQHFVSMPEVDSVTLDPHKSGFIPYPAGGLCYRNGRMRDLIAYTAPVVFHGGTDTSVGSYGIEGSKPGAAAASAYLSHKTIPLDRSGYGRLLGRCLFNSRRLYAALATMDLQKTGKAGKIEPIVVPFQRLPAEREGGSAADILEQKKYIADNFVGCTTRALIEEVLGMKKAKPTRAQLEARELFARIGSDLSIVTYLFNFRTEQGINTDLEVMNRLNDAVFHRLSLKTNEAGELPSAEMFVTASTFDPAHYGSALVDNLCNRAGVETVPGTAVNFLISTTQNPWLSANTEEDAMLGKLIDILRATVVEEARKLA